MMTAVTDALASVITAIGSVVSELTTSGGDLYALLPLLAIGVAISLFMFAIKAIKSVIWGA